MRVDDEELENLFEECEPEDEAGNGMLSDAEIEEQLIGLLSDDPIDFDEVYAFLAETEDTYSGDLAGFAFRTAVRCGAEDYVEENADYVELNDGPDGTSTYLQETDDPVILEILLEHGAYRGPERYDRARFAMETGKNTILAFSPAFQQEAFEKYLEVYRISAEDVAVLLDEDHDPEEDERLPEDYDRFLFDDCDALGVCLVNGTLRFRDKRGEDGTETEDLLWQLGWQCEYECPDDASGIPGADVIR